MNASPIDEAIETLCSDGMGCCGCPGCVERSAEAVGSAGDGATVRHDRRHVDLERIAGAIAAFGFPAGRLAEQARLS